MPGSLQLVREEGKGGVIMTGCKQDTEKDILQESRIVVNTLDMMQHICLECDRTATVDKG